MFSGTCLWLQENCFIETLYQHPHGLIPQMQMFSHTGITSAYWKVDIQKENYYIPHSAWTRLKWEDCWCWSSKSRSSQGQHTRTQHMLLSFPLLKYCNAGGGHYKLLNTMVDMKMWSQSLSTPWQTGNHTDVPAWLTLFPDNGPAKIFLLLVSWSSLHLSNNL